MYRQNLQSPNRKISYPPVRHECWTVPLHVARARYSMVFKCHTKTHAITTFLVPFKCDAKKMFKWLVFSPAIWSIWGSALSFPLTVALSCDSNEPQMVMVLTLNKGYPWGFLFKAMLLYSKLVWHKLWLSMPFGEQNSLLLANNQKAN